MVFEGGGGGPFMMEPMLGMVLAWDGETPFVWIWEFEFGAASG